MEEELAGCLWQANHYNGSTALLEDLGGALLLFICHFVIFSPVSSLPFI